VSHCQMKTLQSFEIFETLYSVAEDNFPGGLNNGGFIIEYFSLFSVFTQ
jgi:hypothetical protein